MKATTRFAELVAKADELGHSVYVIVTVGKPKDGDPLTFGFLPGEDRAEADLHVALDRVTRYLDSDTAEERSVMLRRKDLLKRRLDQYAENATATLIELRALQEELGFHAPDPVPETIGLEA